MLCSYSQGDEPVPGFRLVSRLGERACSQVWKAAAPGGAEVALKIVALADGYALKELRALRLYRRVRHPNLVPLLAFWVKDAEGRLLSDEPSAEPPSAGPAPAELLIAMGLGDRSLADRLGECLTEGQGGLPRDELLRLLGDAARALDYLHQPIHEFEDGPRALQHCDVKPGNILLVGGAAQVCDLGILRVVGDLRRTAPIGTAAYLAPEIIRDGRPSAATDQYALAVSYFELRTGELPFQASSPEGAYFAHLQGRLDFGRVPAAEAAVLTRATAQRPEARYPSCGALVDALERAGDGTEDILDLSPAAAEEPARPAEPPGAVPERVHLWRTGSDHFEAPGQLGVAPDQPEAPATAAPRPPRQPGRSRRRLAGVGAILAGIGVGLLGSWLSRGSPVAVATPATVQGPKAPPGRDDTGPKVASPVKPFAGARPPTGPFALASAARAFPDLAEAVAAAVDGDTVTIHGDGPFVIGPLEVRGKALTIKAGLGSRPRLRLDAAARHMNWRPLLASDRALRLEGLELSRDVHSAEPAYLVSCEQASLHLSECSLLAPRGSAPVVCRNPRNVELRDCVIVAHAVALAVEVGDAPECVIRLSGCSVQIGDRAGAALSVFAPADTSAAAPVRLRLARNTVEAGRVAAFKALQGGLHIEATGNDLAFREALLSFVTFRGRDGWRQATSWHGQVNHYHGPADWIQLDGARAGVDGLAAWRALWRSPETGSSSTETSSGSQALR